MTQAARGVHTTRHWVRALIPLVLLSACRSSGGDHRPCEAESDAELCAAASRLCGAMAATDRCGVTRTVATCGECAGSLVCGADGLCTSCTPETDAELCLANGIGCGSSTAGDRCGHMRLLACGECPESWTCGMDLLCHCTGESDEQLCAAAHYACGRLQNVFDVCGLPRDVSTCGSCRTGETCASDKICRIRPESDASFCASQQRECGAASGVDQSGLPRFVANCGECTDWLGCTPGGRCSVPGEGCDDPIRLTFDPRGHASAAGNFWVKVSDAQGSCAQNDNEPDVLFAFTLEDPKLVTVAFKAAVRPYTAVRPTLYVRSSCDQASSEVACSAAQIGDRVNLTTRLDAGTWFLWVDGNYPEDLGPIDLNVDALDPSSPPNDACEGALALPPFAADNTVSITGTTLAARDDGEVPRCGGHDGPDLVYTFEVTSPSDARLTLTPTDWTPVVYLRQGCSEGNAAALACRPADSFGNMVTFDAKGLSPGTYSIWVDGAGRHDSGDFILKVKVFPGGFQPNDHCSGAIPLPFTSGVASLDGDTRGAVDDTSGSCGSMGGADVFYAFRLALPRRVTARATADRLTSSFQADLQIRADCSAIETEYGCASDLLVVPELPAGDYYLIVDGTIGNAGAFTLKVTLDEPTADAGCDTPQPLLIDTSTGMATAHGDTRGKWSYEHGSCTPDTAQAQIAYRMVTPWDASVTITATPGVASSLVPEVLLRLNCEDHVDAEAGCVNGVRGGAAVLYVPGLSRGVWYLLVGDGSSGEVGSEGTFDLTVQLGPPVLTRPAHDDCTDPEVLAYDPAAGPLTVVRNSAGANSDLWASCGGMGGGDLVFAFDLTTPAAVRVTATATTPGFAPLVYVRESCASYPATDERGCATPTNGIAVLTTPRLPVGRHFLIVDDAGFANGGFQLKLEPAVAPPDTCAETTAMALAPGQPLRLQGNTALATPDATLFGCGFSAPGNDVVYQLTTLQTLNVAARLTYPAGLRQALLALRSDCANEHDRSGPCASGPDPGSSDATTLNVHLLPAGTWYLWVDSKTSTTSGQGPYELQIDATVPAAAPANDTCAAAQAITFVNGAFSAQGDLSGARNDVMGSCGGALGPDVIYSFEVPAGAAQQVRAQVIARPGTDGFEPVVYVRQACEVNPPLPPDTACSHNGSSTATVSSAPAGSYHLVVDANSPVGGAFDLQVWLEPAAVVPDTCATAMALDVSASPHLILPLDPTLAANDARSLRCGAGAGPDLIVTFDTTGLGLRDVHATATTTATAVYPVLYLRRVCAATTPADEVACTSSSMPTVDLMVRSLPEGRYYLWIDSNSGSIGAPVRLDLEVTASPGPPANDDCSAAQALDLTSGSASATGDLTWATPSGTACGLGGDVTYSFTLSQTQSVTVSVTPDPATPWMRAFASLAPACGSASPIECASPSSASPVSVLQARSLAAGTYYLSVAYGYPGSEGRFALDVTRDAPIPSAPGDDCTNPIDLHALVEGSPLVVSGTTATAHFDQGLTFSAPGAKDLVYSFTVLQQQRVLVSVVPLSPGFEPALELRQRCDFRNTYSTASSAPGLAALWYKTNFPAGTWYLWVSSGDASALPTEGAFELRIEAQSGSPGYDTCGTARALTRGVATIGSTVGSCDLISGPLSATCGGGKPIGSDAVYLYTPAASAPFEVIVTAMNGGYRPVAWVAANQCGVPSACFAIASPGVDDQYRTTVGNAVAGQTYYVMVDGGHTTSGMFVLEVR